MDFNLIVAQLIVNSDYRKDEEERILKRREVNLESARRLRPPKRPRRTKEEIKNAIPNSASKQQTREIDD